MPSLVPTNFHVFSVTFLYSTTYSIILLPPSFSGTCQESTNVLSVTPDTSTGARGGLGTSKKMEKFGAIYNHDLFTHVDFFLNALLTALHFNHNWITFDWF